MAHDLDLPTIADGQADGQWQTSNDADAALGNAFGDILTVDFSSGNVTLTSAQFRSAMLFVPTGLSANRDLTIPGVKRAQFLVHNTDSTYSITLKRGTGAIVIAPGEIGRFWTDGTTNSLEGSVIEAADGGASVPESYDFAMPYYSGQPTSSEVLARIPIVRDITIPADFSGSVGYALAANPTSSFAIDVQDDGVSIGTITISTGGTYTFATSGGTAKSVAAGSRITLVAPSSADGTIDGIQVGFKASEA